MTIEMALRKKFKRFSELMINPEDCMKESLKLYADILVYKAKYGVMATSLVIDTIKDGIEEDVKQLGWDLEASPTKPLTDLVNKLTEELSPTPEREQE